MLPKIILVIYLITGRSQVQIQYAVSFPTESACMAESSKYKRSGWQAYPVIEAVCTFDIKVNK